MYTQKLRLDGRVAVVTGGARNIGLACVTALAELAPASSLPIVMRNWRLAP
ncbi:hypothetical protein RAA17_10810 [Komagataeibacter rhaeticus]|nr:hypothetical protein [Komagataeibacter rhaeticus]